jgi:hypothetical protein
MDVTGLLKLGGQEEGKYIYLNGNIGMIYTSDYRSGESGWMISPLLAEFENGKFRGTLLDTIVETVHVQTIGGAVMLAKSGTIRKINKIYEYSNGAIDCEVIVEG